MIRFFDILLSFLGLIFLSPVFLILSVWIKLDSRGPLFFKQVRVGKDNIDFNLYKFRSMFNGSDKKGLLTIGEKDSRITKSGLFIRKFKLDELPQLINVLRGEMSMVGPRPEVREYVNYYNEEQRTVLSIRPGISDWASIKYSNENEVLSTFIDPEKAYLEIVMPEKIKLNLNYVQNQTIKEYFEIILSTLKKIIFG